MAKKKKTQLKPVARGFATTSQPKKVVPPPEEPEVTPEASTIDTEPAPTDSAGAATPITSQDPVDDFDPEKVEEQSLQNLVDKLQEKTERDIVRTVKVRLCRGFIGCTVALYVIKAIEIDRRYTKTLSTLELDSEVLDNILRLSAEAESADDG